METEVDPEKEANQDLEVIVTIVEGIIVENQ